MSEGTKGNAVVLVVKDSSAGFWEHELTKETIFNAGILQYSKSLSLERECLKVPEKTGFPPPRE